MAKFKYWLSAYVGDPYFRVEDEGSQAVTRPGQGIRAPGRAAIDFRARYGQSLRVLKRNVINHMDWQSPYVSSLISTYRDEEAAWAEAERRVARGRRNVTITVIDAQLVYGRVEYRNLRHLAHELNIPIPRQAWHNSEHEYVFLHYIPQRAVRDVIPVS
ncbi:hypothetical protein MGU_10982 [Metarhizium guizhouense ARSEF 977]|uniref:DUF7587 domain-containing protein n=1 Tax=Metarhizium guizhouense (strain ARSEF 977) TaxID=1276136 RepID=A0A0B4G4X8_METGA|nr:hypothetical protein MGU_10982 [Metarhizium guizhouense ARSEF 977]